MAPVDFNGVGALVVAAATLITATIGGVVTYRKARHEQESSDHQYLDALFEKLNHRVQTLEHSLQEAAKRERVFTSYVFQLQLHISEGKPPPPPPWPSSLLPEERK